MDIFLQKSCLIVMEYNLEKTRSHDVYKQALDPEASNLYSSFLKTT